MRAEKAPAARPERGPGAHAPGTALQISGTGICVSPGASGASPPRSAGLAWCRAGGSTCPNSCLRWQKNTLFQGRPGKAGGPMEAPTPLDGRAYGVSIGTGAARLVMRAPDARFRPPLGRYKNTKPSKK